MTRDEWLKYRLGGIGSSDAPILHGVSPYATPRQLYEVKIKDTYEEEESNFAQTLGNELEPKARMRFASLWNFDHFSDETFDPVLLEMKDLPFLRASLDGASKDLKDIIEIKFLSRPSADDPNKMTKGKIRHLSVIDESLPITHPDENFRSRVPFIYYIQMAHQLMVSGAERCHFISYEPSPIEGMAASLHSCEVVPDPEFMETHLAKCLAFWDHVTRKIPPHLVHDDYKSLRIAGGKKLAQAYKQDADKVGDQALFDLMTSDLQTIDGLYLNRIEKTVRTRP